MYYYRYNGTFFAINKLNLRYGDNNQLQPQISIFDDKSESSLFHYPQKIKIKIEIILLTPILVLSTN